MALCMVVPSSSVVKVLELRARSHRFKPSREQEKKKKKKKKPACINYQRITSSKAARNTRELSHAACED